MVLINLAHANDYAIDVYSHEHMVDPRMPNSRIRTHFRNKYILTQLQVWVFRDRLLKKKSLLELKQQMATMEPVRQSMSCFRFRASSSLRTRSPPCPSPLLYITIASKSPIVP